jgi:hypothetical protein
MTDEERKTVAMLVVDYLHLQAEFRAVRSLLNVYQGMPAPPTWQKGLAAMRELPDYRIFLDSFEPELSQVRQDADETALIALLHKIELRNLPS